MEVIFLVLGVDEMQKFKRAVVPDGQSAPIVAKYGGAGIEIYLITIVVPGEGLETARVLANWRDSFELSGKVRIFSDDASAFFCDLLYPEFRKFERGLHAAILFAACSEPGNLSNDQLNKLENLTLDELYRELLVDKALLARMKEVPSSHKLQKADLIKWIEGLEENVVWDKLFGDELEYVRTHLKELISWRNAVMHHHTMSSDAFDAAMGLVNVANETIGSYIETAMANTERLPNPACRAREAGLMLSDNSLSDLANMVQAFSISAPAIEALQSQLANMTDSLTYQSNIRELSETLTQLSTSYASTLANLEGVSSSIAKVVEGAQATIDIDELAVASWSSVSDKLANSLPEMTALTELSGELTSSFSSNVLAAPLWEETAYPLYEVDSQEDAPSDNAESTQNEN